MYQDQKPVATPEQIKEIIQSEVTPKFEEINHKDIRVGTLAQFAQEVFKKPLDQLDKLASGKLAGVWLAIEKFKTSKGKFYRLVWVSNKAAWLASENTTEFRRVYYDDGAAQAAKKLSEELGVRFSEIAR
jgi:hypothetical protein